MADTWKSAKFPLCKQGGAGVSFSVPMLHFHSGHHIRLGLESAERLASDEQSTSNRADSPGYFSCCMIGNSCSRSAECSCFLRVFSYVTQCPFKYLLNVAAIKSSSEQTDDVNP